MTRFGWIFIGLAVLLIGGFLSMTSFGGRPAAAIRTAAALRRVLPPHVVEALPGKLAVPVEGYPRSAIQNNWGDARGGGTRAHHGTDIMAPGGAKVVAAAAGTIEKLFQSRLGGTTLYVRSLDRRWTYYYAHLAGYAPGIREGMAVRPGDPLGFVGNTGDAGPGNFHLHFGVEKLSPDQRWWQGEETNPYPLLAGTTRPR
jgi:murein DD-endopeptidase MepM/ murein hydrolase activator NlpD